MTAQEGYCNTLYSKNMKWVISTHITPLVKNFIRKGFSYQRFYKQHKARHQRETHVQIHHAIREIFHLIYYILTHVTIGSWPSVKKIHLVTSMIFIFCSSPYTVEMSKVSSNTQGNLLSVRSCKIRKQVTSFQYTMAQNIHLHSKREEREHSEGRLVQDKTEAQQDRTSNPTALSQMHGASVSKGLGSPIPETSHTFLSLGTSIPYIQPPLRGRYLIALVFQHFVVSKCNPGFILTASRNGLSQSPYWVSVTPKHRCLQCLKPQTKNP